MAGRDRGAQAFAWVTRRQSSVAGMTDEQVVAMQKRQGAGSKVTHWIFGTVPPGVAANDQVIPGPGAPGGPGGEIPVRVYRAAAGPRPAARPRAPGFPAGGCAAAL